ncbi:hypothetical protein CPY51_26165 [Rhizobium tubonense]|uniref:Uncharacterized protein n=1 Tax=Rhizobium tubonense TaxID=484088 RepID=A0A2W4C8L6_9HYPH|nr:hypothetical protein CPY51_26165 [Rhizobium tubonense]
MLQRGAAAYVEHKALTLSQNILIAATEKEDVEWFVSNELLCATTWHQLPGRIPVFRFLPKPRPKRRRKPSDVSGLPLSPRPGWGQEPAIGAVPPHRTRGEMRKRA